MVARSRSPRRPRIAVHPARAVVLAFAAAVLVGAGLLMLPLASSGQGGAPAITALFTSTSAVCVTGLIVVDTATYWSNFGQAVILALIQIGGLGILSAATLLFLLLRRRLGVGGSLRAQTESHAVTPAEVRRVVVAVAVISASVETLVAAALSARFWAEGAGFATGLWRGPSTRFRPSTTPAFRSSPTT
jgi:trk/ktr system potassium uptake protein